MKVVLCTMCSCAGGPLISSGMSRTTIKAETWRPHTALTATCGCLSHTHTQSPTHTHKPPDWSHHLDAPSASSPCAWMWPLTSPPKSKAQESSSLGSHQFDIKLTHSGTNPLSLHHPVVGGASVLGGALLEKHFRRYANWFKLYIELLLRAWSSGSAFEHRSKTAKHTHRL